MKKLVFFLFLLPLFVHGQTPDKEVEERIRQVENSLTPTLIFGDSMPNANISERMAALKIKGVSIAVIKNYKLEWAKGYGWADSAEGREVTTNTRFQAASISKSLNSLGVLKLVQDGKIDPEADINMYLRTWKFPYDTVSKDKKINIYNLLSHTAGLDIHGFPGYERNALLPNIYQVLKGERPANTKKVRSLFEPGLKFKYSGGGTTISQLIVTDVALMLYADYMQSEVLGPLGMKNSSYKQPPTDTTVLASGYYANGSRVNGKFHVYPEQAAAGLWTTPTDLAKYIIECQLALEGRSKKVLSADMMKRRMEPYIDSNAALGVFVTQKGDRKYFNHNGGNEGFVCTSYGSLEGGDGVVIMTNSENFNIIEELTNSVARVYGWKDFFKPEFRKVQKLAREDLDNFVGNFKLANDTLTVTICGDELCLRQNGQAEPGYKMIFTDNDNFSIREVPSASFKAIRNDKGYVESLQLLQNGLNLALPRLK
ncbi:MAG TPA: serine hydrolase domain-containing protein [Chitinophagaceae bacterium]|nr:serine hydrolase domain-containing protein [Chitinophagaceae bacterium]